MVHQDSVCAWDPLSRNELDLEAWQEFQELSSISRQVCKVLSGVRLCMLYLLMMQSCKYLLSPVEYWYSLFYIHLLCFNVKSLSRYESELLKSPIIIVSRPMWPLMLLFHGTVGPKTQYINICNGYILLVNGSLY